MEWLKAHRTVVAVLAILFVAGGIYVTYQGPTEEDFSLENGKLVVPRPYVPPASWSIIEPDAIWSAEECEKINAALYTISLHLGEEDPQHEVMQSLRGKVRVLGRDNDKYDSHDAYYKISTGELFLKREELDPHEFLVVLLVHELQHGVEKNAHLDWTRLKQFSRNNSAMERGPYQKEVFLNRRVRAAIKDLERFSPEVRELWDARYQYMHYQSASRLHYHTLVLEIYAVQDWLDKFRRSSMVVHSVDITVLDGLLRKMLARDEYEQIDVMRVEELIATIGQRENNPFGFSQGKLNRKFGQQQQPRAWDPFSEPRHNIPGMPGSRDTSEPIGPDGRRLELSSHALGYLALQNREKNQLETIRRLEREALQRVRSGL